MTDAQIKTEPENRIPYDDQKRVARDGSHDERSDLAGREDVRPEILYYLAGDPDPGVRRKIARNELTPPHADLMLAQDDDDRVRSDVAGKIATTSLTMDEGEQTNVYKVTMQALEILAGDQLVRVRQILAETLKDSAGVPVHIIEKLALDRELTVSGLVLEHSPILDDEFLIRVLNSEPVQGALKAISRRVALGEEVADAIVNSGDAEAVAELLGNESAQIREETLDRIVDQAPGQPGWHGPLVQRPGLHVDAMRRIADIVSETLLAELKKRADLDDGSVAAIDEVIQRRLDGRDIEDLAEIWSGSQNESEGTAGVEDPDWATSKSDPGPNPVSDASLEPEWAKTKTKTKAEAEAEDSAQIKRAKKLHKKGTLGEKQVSAALNDGEMDFVIAAMSLLADVPKGVVRKAASLQNAKALVALAWKSGLSMRLATRLQMNLAKIPPSGVLRATASDGYPISPDEMTWQLEFVAGMADGD